MSGGVTVHPGRLANAVQALFRRSWRTPDFASGFAAVAVAGLALVVNPYGWRLYEVPFKLAHLVDQPHIPNPEWVSPTFAQAPTLYLALAVTIVVMGESE